MSLYDTVQEAIRIRNVARAAGESETEIIAALERSIREAWPKGREWHYLCDRCNDYGAIHHVCRAGQRCPGISTRTDGPKESPGKYQRICAKHPESEYQHDYITPCSCPAGDRFRPAVRSAANDVEQAAKTPKKSFKKFGDR